MNYSAGPNAQIVDPHSFYKSYFFSAGNLSLILHRKLHIFRVYYTNNYCFFTRIDYNKVKYALKYMQHILK